MLYSISGYSYRDLQLIIETRFLPEAGISNISKVVVVVIFK